MQERGINLKWSRCESSILALVAHSVPTIQQILLPPMSSFRLLIMEKTQVNVLTYSILLPLNPTTLAESVLK